jgi:hypothetical protein
LLLGNGSCQNTAHMPSKGNPNSWRGFLGLDWARRFLWPPANMAALSQAGSTFPQWSLWVSGQQSHLLNIRVDTKVKQSFACFFCAFSRETIF